MLLVLKLVSLFTIDALAILLIAKLYVGSRDIINGSTAKTLCLVSLRPVPYLICLPLILLGELTTSLTVAAVTIARRYGAFT